MLATHEQKQLRTGVKKQRSKRRPSRRIPVTLWLLPEVYRRVVSIQYTRKLGSVEDVFREGFRLLEFITEKEVAGWTVKCLLEKPGSKAVATFILEKTH
jgi:hypothetical protein